MPETTQTRWRRIEALFHHALDLPEPDRTEYLRAQCAEDPTLLAEVLELLESDSSVEQKRSAGQTRFAAQPAPEDESSRWLNRTLGNYRLLRELGRGGMGVVYAAQRTGAGTQEVAVKLVRRNLRTSPALKHFLVERDALARLAHKNIAGLIDGGFTEEGLPYLVMEYVEGLRLDDACIRTGTTIRTVLDYVLQLCDAVTYVHRNLILHRDLKPGNVMVTAEGIVKLLDFGTLKLMGPATSDSAMTQAGMRPVTLRYASPEHINGRPVSTATDVFSLGVILYRLIAGRLPEDAERLPVADYLRRLRDGQVPPPSAASTFAMPRELARDLDAITMKAMRYAADDRYPSAEALAAEIRRALASQPVHARGDSRRYLAASFYRRNLWPIWTTAAIVLVLATGLTWMARETRIARAAKLQADQGAEKERQLAHLLLFDYFTTLQQIPGSTDAQRKAVSEAVQYLDGLSATAPGPEVRLETVRAYTAMGTLLGSPYYQNLGDKQGAIQTLNKALPLADRLVHDDPRNPAYQSAQGGLQMALGQVYMGAGEPAKALAALKPAAETAWILANAPHADLKTTLAASTPLGLLGDLYFQRGSGNLRDPARATEIYERSRWIGQRALELDPTCARCRRNIAVSYTKLGQLAEEIDTDRALADFNAGLAAIDGLPPAERAKPLVVRSYGTLHLALIELYLFTGHKAEAESLLNAERTRELAEVALDPIDSRARYDLAATDSTALSGYQALDDHAGALLEATRYLDSATILLRQEPAEPTWKSIHAIALGDQGKALADSGAAAAGNVEVAAALDLLLPMADAKDADPDVLGAAASFLIFLKRNPPQDAPQAVAYAQRAIAAAGTPSSDALLLLAEAHQYNHDAPQSKLAATQALKLLEATPKGMGHQRDIQKAKSLLAQ